MPHSVALTDVDWQHFAKRFADQGSLGELTELLNESNLLLLGGGSPAGFMEFWLGQIIYGTSFGSEKRTWIGKQVHFSHDSGLARYLRGLPQSCRVFDDASLAGFLSQLAHKWQVRHPTKTAGSGR